MRIKRDGANGAPETQTSTGQGLTRAAGQAISGARRRVPGVRLGPLPRPPRIPVPGPRRRIRFGRIAPLLAVLGPGLIAGIAGNDAGGITTYSVMGAQTGFYLLWIFPITIVVLAVVQEMAARLGTISGQGLSDLIRDWFGVRWTAFAMLVLLVANLANTVAEFAGAASALEIFGVSRLITVPVLTVALWAVVFFANYRRLERVFLLVSLVFVAYIAAAWLVHPGGGQVVSGFLHPTFQVPGVSVLQVLLLAVAVVGTTITPYMQFYLQSAVAEKGIGEDELGYERTDAILGSIWTNGIAICIVIATGAVLFGTGVVINDAADAAKALQPVAGDLSTELFAVGLFGASALAAMIMPISTAFVICEAFGWESGVGKKIRDAPAFFTLFTFVLVAGALVTLLPGIDLIGLILGSQYLQGLLLPIVLVFMVMLVNNKRLLGKHANGRLLNTLAVASVGLVIVLDVTLLGASVAQAAGLLPA